MVRMRPDLPSTGSATRPCHHLVLRQTLIKSVLPWAEAMFLESRAGMVMADPRGVERPWSRFRKGRTTTWKITMADTTWPGRPHTGFLPDLARIVGFPGLMEIPWTRSLVSASLERIIHGKIPDTHRTSPGDENHIARDQPPVGTRSKKGLLIVLYNTVADGKPHPAPLTRPERVYVLMSRISPRSRGLGHREPPRHRWR